MRLQGKLKAGGYARISTDLDSQDGSFAEQLRSLERAIQGDSRLELVEIYGDRGISGRSREKRPEINRLMEDAEKEKFQVVYTKSISRLARNLQDCIHIHRRLKACGCSIRFLREGLDTSTMQGEMIFTILGAVAACESESISANMKQARGKALQGGVVWSRPRYGYRWDERKNWVIDQREAARIRLMFQMTAAGSPCREIIRRLNGLEEAEGTKKRWTRAMIDGALRSECYIGDYLSNKQCRVVDLQGKGHTVKNNGLADQVYLQDHHPPIVGRALFARVNAILDDRKALFWQARGGKGGGSGA